MVVIGNGLAGVWALGAHRLVPLRRRALWWVTGAAEVAGFVQVGTGVWLVAVDDIDVAQFHMFYGFLVIIAVAILYSYRQQLRAHPYLLYGFGGLFIMGLAIRAMTIPS